MLLNTMTANSPNLHKGAPSLSVGVYSPLGLFQTLLGVPNIYVLIPAVFIAAFFVPQKWNDVFKPIHNYYKRREL